MGCHPGMPGDLVIRKWEKDLARIQMATSVDQWSTKKMLALKDAVTLNERERLSAFAQCRGREAYSQNG